MKIKSILKNAAFVAVFGITVAFMSGCGGVSETEMNQLNNLRSEVNSLQKKADSLKDQRSTLEKQISQQQAKLQNCNKQKEETKANLQKIGQ